MYCPNCKTEYNGKFCPECGTKLIVRPSAEDGFNVNIGDANAISGGLHVSDSHAVHNEDKSIHNITNTSSTVNNITQMSAQKTEMELLQERKTLYLNACKRAYEDNVLEQSEVVELETLRIQLGLDKATADCILETTRVMSDRNARKSTLNPIVRTKLKILTKKLQKNEVKALMDQIDSLEPLVRKYDHDELSRKYFLVLAALKHEKCIEQKEKNKTDTYWEAFWCYLAYIKAGRQIDAEETLASLDRFFSYPEDNMTVLAAAGALMMGHKEEAKEYLDAATGEYTPALQRFVDSIYLLVAPQKAKKTGVDENTCAFYLVNFFGQKDPKAKAEEERLRAEEEALRSALLSALLSALQKRCQAEEVERRKEEERRKAEEAKRRAEEEAKREEERRKAEEAKRRAEEKAKRKEERERRKAEEAKRKAEEAKRKAEEEALRKRRQAEEAERKRAEEAKKRRANQTRIKTVFKEIGQCIRNNLKNEAREVCIVEKNGMGLAVREGSLWAHTKHTNDLFTFIDDLQEKNQSRRRISRYRLLHFTFNSRGMYCAIYGWFGGSKWVGEVPPSMRNRLDEYFSGEEEIISVSIAENGDWAIITEKKYSGVSRAVEAVKKAGKLYGDQKSIALTDQGVVVCCENGVYYQNIPNEVIEGIDQWLRNGRIPARISFTDSGAYFISNDKIGEENKNTFNF